MTKLLKYEEKFQVDILRRYYKKNCRMHFFDYDGFRYYTDGYVVYKMQNSYINWHQLCNYMALESVISNAELKNQHKLRYKCKTLDNLYLYLTDENVEVYINPTNLKNFDKPENLELYCDGSPRNIVSIKVSYYTIGYIMPVIKGGKNHDN